MGEWNRLRSRDWSSGFWPIDRDSTLLLKPGLLKGKWRVCDRLCGWTQSFGFQLMDWDSALLLNPVFRHPLGNIPSASDLSSSAAGFVVCLYLIDLSLALRSEWFRGHARVSEGWQLRFRACSRICVCGFLLIFPKKTDVSRWNQFRSSQSVILFRWFNLQLKNMLSLGSESFWQSGHSHLWFASVWKI